MDENIYCICGEKMEVYDTYSMSFGKKTSSNITVTEWKCPECGYIYSDEPEIFED